MAGFWIMKGRADMKITLSKHTQFKFQERKIEIQMIEKTFEIYDLIAKTTVAIRKIKIVERETNYVIFNGG